MVSCYVFVQPIKDNGLFDKFWNIGHIEFKKKLRHARFDANTNRLLLKNLYAINVDRVIEIIGRVPISEIPRCYTGAHADNTSTPGANRTRAPCYTRGFDFQSIS